MHVLAQISHSLPLSLKEQETIMDKSVACYSQSYFKIQRIMDHIDKQLNFIPTSSRHCYVSWEDDVKQLVKQFKRADIFNFDMVNIIPIFLVFQETILYCWVYWNLKDGFVKSLDP